MKENNQSSGVPEQNNAEESTKGFPAVTEQDEANAASFQMKKKQSDGSWVAAMPVHITNSSAEQPAAEPEKPEKTGPAEETKEPAAEAKAPQAEEQPQPEPPVQPSEPEQPTAEKPKKTGIGRRIAEIIIGVAAVAVIGFSVYVYTYSKIFPGVEVAENYKLSGMTQQEAQTYISGDVQTEIFDKELPLTGKDLVAETDKDYGIKLSDVAQAVDSETSAKQAYLIGREGNYFQRTGTVLKSMFTGWNISLNASLKEGAVAEQVNKIAADLNYEPIQPSWQVNRETAELTVDTGKQGVSFDTDTVVSDVSAQVSTMNLEPYTIDTYIVEQNKPDAAAIAQDINTPAQNAIVDKNDGQTVIEAVDGIKIEESAIASAIGDASEQTYTMPVEMTKATITKADLEPVLFRDTLASSTTYYNSGQTSRTTNVRLAANACDGTILNPGEEFSYNGTVGERTRARGYRSAIIFSDGQEVEGTGGGVCQPSSTIYMAALRADMKVTERSCHQFQVSYTPVSQDAAVYWGSKDFRFVNNTNYPIRINMSVGGGSLTCTITGTKTDSTPEVSLSSRSYVSGRYKYATLYKTVTVNGESTTTQENTSAYLLG